MFVRSTGLGKQQMTAQIASIQLVEKDAMIMHCETSEPVRWHIRIVMGHDDIVRLIGQLLKPKSLWGVTKILLFKRGGAKPEGEW
ncbi:MAG: hypothetical protein WC749_13610 [Dehalococcoidia bacterium]